MFDVKPPNYIYCPFCANKLQTKLEEGIKRQFCPRDNWTYYPYMSYGIVSVIINESKVLLVKRAREPYMNTWTLPSGYSSYAEHPLDTLSREVNEETGLTIIAADLINILQSFDDPRNLGNLEIFYKVTQFKGDVKTDKIENKDIQWFEIDNLPKMGWATHKHIMGHLQKSEI